MKQRIKDKLLAVAAVILCTASLMSVAGCGSNEPSYAEREQLIEELYGAVELETTDQTGGNATTSNFVMAYFKEDTMNPYLCTSTLNATVSELIYDQLITVNSEFEAEMVIAQSVEYTGNRVISVTLRDGIVFSDGTALTGKDIVYSFEAACREATADTAGSRYASSLANFQSCINSGNKVTFRLNEADPRAYMLLDFPIIKAESDADGKVPLGSGRYVYISDVLTGTYLLRNEKWYNTNVSDVRRISLTSMPTVESIVKSVEIGTISYYYTDLRYDDKYYPSRINANYSFVDINNLVYIGVNTAEPTLGQTSVRKAISGTIDREDVIASGFAGRAYAATGPLTTSWPVAAAAQSGSPVGMDKETVENMLKEANFVNTSAQDGVRYNDRGEYLDYEILVNERNKHHMQTAEQIASQLRKVGINVTVVGVPFTVFLERIAAGEYDLYLAEYALLNNMDFSALFTPNKGLYYGLIPQQTIDSWNDYLNGVSGIEKAIQSFEAELPFIPVCYRLGLACYSRSMNSKPDVSESDPFWGMEKWDVALAE